MHLSENKCWVTEITQQQNLFLGYNLCEWIRLQVLLDRQPQVLRQGESPVISVWTIWFSPGTDNTFGTVYLSRKRKSPLWASGICYQVKLKSHGSACVNACFRNCRSAWLIYGCSGLKIPIAIFAHIQKTELISLLVHQVGQNATVGRMQLRDAGFWWSRSRSMGA